MKSLFCNLLDKIKNNTTTILGVVNYRTYTSIKPARWAKFLRITPSRLIGATIVLLTIAFLWALSSIALSFTGEEFSDYIPSFSHSNLLVFGDFKPFKIFCLGY